MCKIDIAIGNFLCVAGNPKPVLCDNLEGKTGRELGGGFRREGTYVCLWLIHVDVGQKPIQYCKLVILQLKIKVKNI